MTYHIFQDPISGGVYFSLGLPQATYPVRVGGGFQSLDRAINHAVANGLIGDYHIPPGRHAFDAVVNITLPVTVKLHAATEVSVNHAGAVGAFHFQSNNTGLIGPGGIVAPTAYADQDLVKFTNCLAPTISGVYVDFLTDNATSANPQTGIKFDTCVAPIITGCKVYPGEGTRGYHIVSCSYGSYDRNHWGAKSGRSLEQDGTELWTKRRGWRGLQVEGWTHFDIGVGCTFHGVGSVLDPNNPLDDASDFIVDKMVYIKATNLGGDNAEESGHAILHGIKSEGVHARNLYWIEGQYFLHWFDTQIGASSGPKRYDPANNRVDCAVFIQGIGAKANQNFVMDGVNIHNTIFGGKETDPILGKTPPMVSLSGAFRWEIKNCSFDLINSGTGIYIDQGLCWQGYVHDNHFVGGSGGNPAQRPWRLQCGVVRGESGQKIIFKNNVCVNFDHLHDSVEVMGLGFAGINPTGLNFDPALKVTTTASLAVKGGGNPTITAAAGTPFSGLLVGDLVDLRGPVTAGTGVVGNWKSNVGLMKIKAKPSGTGSNITVETNPFFTDFVANEGPVAITLDVFERRGSTNIDVQTVAY